MLIQLQGLLAAANFLDFVDVAVVAFFLYRIYLILKDTRAMTLAKGLLVMGIFFGVCKILNLHVITWLLGYILQGLLLALAVVFQPELRRALERLGRGRLFHKGTELNEQELDAMLNQVCDATREMSKAKVGALIVFERATGLVEYVETGTAIDGLVSSGLLQNIFVKDTPLHDCAVIIRGNRIVASNCLLPLTESRNLSQDLGTRHRAAIGLTEQADAVVLVVSEETGAISIARNGELMRYLTLDDVKEILRNSIMRSSNKNKDSLKDLFLEKLSNFRGDKK